MNVYTAPKVDRPLTTGLHTVSDLYCAECDTEVGWFYNFAYEPSQKYKENKFILVENKIRQDTHQHTTHSQTHAHSSSSHTHTSAPHPSHDPSHDPSHAPQPHTPLHQAMDDDEEDDEDDGDEEEGRVASALGFGHAAALGHSLSPSAWTAELTAVLGPDAVAAELSRRRGMVPAEMRVRMRTRAAHAGHSHL